MNGEIKKGHFKDKHVIFSPTRHEKPAIALFLSSLIKILDRRPDVYLVILDNQSSEDIRGYLRSIKHERLILQFLPENIGKARATNEFIAQYIDETSLPRTVWSMDPDVMIDLKSFDYLIEAVENMPSNVKVLGPRYKKNNCDPEMNLWFPPKKVKGKNGQSYRISFPVLCCVAGPILAMTGQTMAETFKMKFFPTDDYLVYGNDDTAIYQELRKKRLKSGYLNGTQATHLKSADKRADEIQEYLNHQT